MCDTVRISYEQRVRYLKMFYYRYAGTDFCYGLNFCEQFLSWFVSFMYRPTSLDGQYGHLVTVILATAPE